MTATYPLVKHAHMALVTVSVLLFALRGAGVLARMPWPMRPAVRHASVLIDVALLAAGVSLWVQLGVALPDAPWLLTKLLLLPLYVVLGSYALKRAKSLRQKAVCYVLALLTVGHMVSAAVHKHPAGVLKVWWA